MIGILGMKLFVSFSFYLITNIFIYMQLEKYILEVRLSFHFLTLIIYLLILFIILIKKTFFESMIGVFYILFFLIAPVIQLNNEILPNTFFINNDYIIKANMLNSIFLLIYVIARLIMKFFKKNKYYKVFSISRIANKTYFIIFIILFLLFSNIFVNKLLFRNIGDDFNSSLALVANKFVFCIPIYFLFEAIIQKRRGEEISKKYIFLLIMLVMIMKNPFTEKRNALGPIYLTLFFLGKEKKIDGFRLLLYGLIIMIFIFPIATIFTHNSNGLVNFNFTTINLKEFNFFNQFKELHFDAWSNLNTSIEMYEHGYFKLGSQFIGSILFFVPRSIWSSKPYSTGKVVGQYLINNYGLNFNNLSSPLTAEMYISFGVVGVIVGAIILAYIGQKCYEFFNSNSYYCCLGWYISFYTIFLLRGDLMNGMAYLIGMLTAIYFAPVMIDTTINRFKKIR